MASTSNTGVNPSPADLRKDAALVPPLTALAIASNGLDATKPRKYAETPEITSQHEKVWRQPMDFLLSYEVKGVMLETGHVNC